MVRGPQGLSHGVSTNSACGIRTEGPQPRQRRSQALPYLLLCEGVRQQRGAAEGVSGEAAEVSMPCKEVLMHRESLRRGLMYADLWMFGTGMSQREIGERYKVSQHTVSKLIWKYLDAIDRRPPDPSAVFVRDEK